MNCEVTGKNVLVTGGTRGIGRAIVTAFAQGGATVYTCGRTDSAEADKLRDELQGPAARHVVDIADVGDPLQCRQLVARAVAALGHIDVLVNNAGVVSHRALPDLDDDEWSRVMDVNLRAVYEVTRAVLPAMRDGSSIVHISSAVASVGMVGRTHYTAAKAAVIGFNRSLCKEVGARGIRANVVAPGIIETDQAAGITPETRARYEQLAALRRLGTPEDVAGVVVFLASDLARFVSGQTLVVDGGI
jgi:3-oxoacyl-[acyl-carrier protein] reductase